MSTRGACVLMVAMAWTTLAGCLPSTGGNGTGGEVVVYTAHDSTFSQPIFERFERRTGATVRAKFDVESTKTVGLVNAIRAEAARPRCDVFWNNEILNTIRLQRQGLLTTYRSPVAEPFPDRFKDPDGQWYGFAARARILICNTELVGREDRPRSVRDLADPRWKGKTAIAKPLFGTTATHVACLFAALGDEEAEDYLRRLRDNDVQVLGGNKQVAQAVAGGTAIFGLTDTDDALQMKNRGLPIEIIYPDQQPGGLGTLFIPNTLCIIKNGPHPEAARKLVDYLLSEQVEAELARGPAGQIPLNPHVEVQVQVAPPQRVRSMEVDFHEAAGKWERAVEFVEQLFLAE